VAHRSATDPGRTVRGERGPHHLDAEAFTDDGSLRLGGAGGVAGDVDLDDRPVQAVDEQRAARALPVDGGLGGSDLLALGSTERGGRRLQVLVEIRLRRIGTWW
jgi:hypothetical protein